MIPVYNDEQYIKECLQSALYQTYRNTEIIIINDGSTDNSLKIIKDMIQNHHNVKLITRENKGICFTRQQLVKEFTGDYAIFLDGDDYIDKDTCLKLIEIILNNPNCNLIKFDYKKFNDNYNYMESKNTGDIIKYKSEEVLKKYIFSDKVFTMVLWGRLYESKLLKQIDFGNNLPEDYYTAFEIYLNANEIIHCSIPLYNYRLRKNSYTIRKEYKDYYSKLIVGDKVYQEEMKYYKGTRYEYRINDIYIFNFFRISAEIYNRLQDPQLKELYDICNKKIKENKKKKISLKTKILIIMYNILPKLTLKFIYNIKIAKKYKEREKWEQSIL